MIIEIKSNNVFDNEGKLIYSFKYNVLDFIKIGDKIIILLDSPINSGCNENVYCIDLIGKLLWQIHKINHIYEDSPYVKIKNVNNVLKVYNYDGYIYNVNMNSGMITSKKFTK